MAETHTAAGHSPALHHQFDTLEQQRLAADVGMWAFLATEVLFFGGLFAGYTIYRVRYEEVFAAASLHLDVVIGTINTAVLLASSLCMAMTVHAAHESHRRGVLAWLAGTILLGLVFLGIKVYEYWDKYDHHLMPLFNLPFRFEEERPDIAEMFFNLYFLMTGLHALHMIIGIGVLLTLWLMAWRGRLLGEFSTPVHVTGLYWHFVDIVWVFLFPFLYLVGAR